MSYCGKFCFFIIILTALFCCKSANEISDIKKIIISGDNKTALKEMEKYIKKHTDDKDALALYAAILHEFKRDNEAIDRVNKAISMESDENKLGLYYFNLGMYYYTMDKMDLSEQSFLKSADHNNKIDSTYYMLGRIYFSKKDIVNCIFYWELYNEKTSNTAKREKLKLIIAKLKEL
jgi:Tfp pilus assembly protein PilF